MSLDVTRLELGPFPVNCYVVHGQGAGEAVVVDPGWPGALTEIEAALAGVRCTAILVTHGDIDHVGGVAELAEATGAPVHMPEGERERLERAADFLPAGFETMPLRSWTPDALHEGGERFDAAGIAFETLLVPGHTEAHLAYAADGHLFSGDVLFAGSVGRTDRPNGDWKRLLASIALLLDRFPPETEVHPGHGPSTTLGRELESNPFLDELRAARR
jgi:glyoxylase-like metal-dependent hydrolase (beta-lactamase superfamily II)